MTSTTTMNVTRAQNIIITDQDRSIAQELMSGKARFGHWENLTYGELTQCLALVTLELAAPVSFPASLRSDRDRKAIEAQMAKF